MSDKSPMELWVEALESGKYKQTVGALRDSVGYCCLGVVCQVYADHHGGAGWKKFETGSYGFPTENYSELYYAEAELPSEVVKWLGVADGNPSVIYVTQQGIEDDVDLAHLNDELGLNFKQIAAVIREQLL